MKRVCGDKLPPPKKARRSLPPPQPSDRGEASTLLDQYLSHFPTQDHEQHVRTLIQEGNQWLVLNARLSPSSGGAAGGIPETLHYQQTGIPQFVGLPASTSSTYPPQYSPIQPPTSHHHCTRANPTPDFQSPGYGDNLGLPPGGYHVWTFASCWWGGPTIVHGRQTRRIAWGVIPGSVSFFATTRWDMKTVGSDQLHEPDQVMGSSSHSASIEYAYSIQFLVHLMKDGTNVWKEIIEINKFEYHRSQIQLYTRRTCTSNQPISIQRQWKKLLQQARSRL